MDNNKNAYSLRKVLTYYGQYTVLQKPEETILNILKQSLPQMRMLDIGVGGGRTTPFFAPQVKEYMAIDFVEKMINICEQKFQGKYANAKFMVGDARNCLSAFTENSFDFVFFSFNGIDHVNYYERKHILQEIKRICSPNGYFCFSTHNIQCINEFIKIKYRWNLYKFFIVLLKHHQFIKKNQEQLKIANSADYIRVFDNVYDFGVDIFYVRPTFQIEMLKEVGFDAIRIFDLKSGRELETTKEISENNDYWLYYLCS